MNSIGFDMSLISFSMNRIGLNMKLIGYSVNLIGFNMNLLGFSIIFIHIYICICIVSWFDIKSMGLVTNFT